MPDTAIIIQAAGSSSRLGTPKQLLLYNNKPLLLHVVDAAVKAGLWPIIVITGSGEQDICAALKNHPVEIVYNNRWQEGMATGIAAGLNLLRQKTEPVESVIVSVCDQPHVNGDLFFKMLEAREISGKAIVACSYADTVGVPVLFSKKYFPALGALSGNEGAKKLLKRFEEDVCRVDFPLGEIDIDTMKDYDNLIR